MWPVVLSKLWPAIPAFILTALLAWWLHTGDVAKTKLKHENDMAAALTAQETRLTKEFEDGKKLTEESLQRSAEKIAGLDARRVDLINQLRRAKEQTCVAVSVAAETSGVASTTSGANPARTVGVPAETIIDEAHDCDTVTQTLIDLQGWVNKLYDARR